MSKSPNSKLLKLKKWLTLLEAAKHLSSVCNDDVTEADILQFALDRQLTLSVNLVNDTMSIPCRIVHYKKADLDTAIANGRYPEELKWQTMPVEIVDHLKKTKPDRAIPKMVLACQQIYEDQYLIHDNFVLAMKGVWDISMIGNECTDVKRKYHNLTGGPEVRRESLQCVDGVFLTGSDGQLYQLQRTSEDQEFQRGSRAEGEKLKQDIAKNNIGEKESTERWKQHTQDRMELFRILNSCSALEDCYPMYHLPSDSIFVIRTEALREFERLLSDNEIKEKTSNKPHGNTERFAINREQILGASFSVLARWPEQCKNRSGKIEATKIRELIESKSYLFWREDGEPPLSTGEIEKLIREWLNKTGE